MKPKNIMITGPKGGGMTYSTIDITSRHCDMKGTFLCFYYFKKYGREGCRYRQSHNVNCLMEVEE